MSTTNPNRPTTPAHTRADTTDLATSGTRTIRRPIRTARVYPLTNVHRIPTTDTDTTKPKKLTLDQVTPWLIGTVKIAAALVALALVASVIYLIALGVAAIVGAIAAGIAWVTKYAVLIGVALLVCWLCSGNDRCGRCGR